MSLKTVETAGGAQPHAEPSVVPAEALSPELVLVDPGLRDAAVAALPEPARTVFRPLRLADGKGPIPLLRLAPEAAPPQDAVVPAARTERGEPSLPVALALYAAVVLGRMLAAGAAFVALIAAVVVVTLLIR